MATKSQPDEHPLHQKSSATVRSCEVQRHCGLFSLLTESSAPKRYGLIVHMPRLLNAAALGTKRAKRRCFAINLHRNVIMNGIIYLVGLIVIIMFILSFLGLR